eukprot:361880-Chlamydomonas_euryale.AAC.3
MAAQHMYQCCCTCCNHAVSCALRRNVTGGSAANIVGSQLPPCQRAGSKCLCASFQQRPAPAAFGVVVGSQLPPCQRAGSKCLCASFQQRPAPAAFGVVVALLEWLVSRLLQAGSAVCAT